MDDLSLETHLEYILERLAMAPTKVDEAWRTPALATLDMQGFPTLRTVVLRAYRDRHLELHTDTRSAKWDELGKDLQVAWCFWDPETKEQLRIQGRCTLHHQDAISQEAWKQLPAHTQASYSVDSAPKTPIQDASGFEFREDLLDEHFGVIRSTTDSVDWLQLGRPKHKRAQFTWLQDAWQSTWLVP